MDNDHRPHLRLSDCDTLQSMKPLNRAMVGLADLRPGDTCILPVEP
jgi:hypothetical protein